MPCAASPFLVVVAVMGKIFSFGAPAPRPSRRCHRRKVVASTNRVSGPCAPQGSRILGWGTCMLGTKEFRAGRHRPRADGTEILATLDDEGTVEGIPFMPEMIPHVGRHYRVSKRSRRSAGTRPRARRGGCRNALPRGPPLRRFGPRRLPGGMPDLLEGGLGRAGRGETPEQRSDEARSTSSATS